MMGWQPFGHTTDRTGQDRTDRQDRQRSDSIGQTILETVSQKLQQKYYNSLAVPSKPLANVSPFCIYQKKYCSCDIVILSQYNSQCSGYSNEVKLDWC